MVACPLEAVAIEAEVPAIVLDDVPFEVVISEVPAGAVVVAEVDGRRYSATADESGIAALEELVVSSTGEVTFAFTSGSDAGTVELRVMPGWVSLLPAFTAIAVALILRSVMPALLLGIWLGATALHSFSPKGAAVGLLDSFQVFVADAVVDPERSAIILFTMMIGGMVGIITRNGGMMAIVKMVVSRAQTAVGAQVAVWLMGLMIFFDDYANTLVVGNTARPITDQLKISREKLAYIVDSTAAPVVSIALITTWIGYQVTLIDEALEGISELADVSAYAVFVQSIPYSFYPILAIAFVLMVAVTGRDMGPMYAAEVRARKSARVAGVDEVTDSASDDTLEPKADVPPRAFNAVVPIVVLVVGLLGGLYATGEGDSIRDIIGSAEPTRAMMWASFIGALTAAVMSVGQRILTTHETVDAWYGGARATLFGMIVLVLAWSMSDVTTALDAKDYMVTIMGDSMPAAWLPAAVFVLAGVTAFATGSSWGTMAILVPLVVPLSWAVMSVNGMTEAGDMHILYSSVSCVLAGAVWGDHCSPISDTTVLSSIASGCNHLEHVRTQLPYALLVGLVGIVFGTVPGGYGVPPWVSLLVGGVVLYVILRLRGRQADAAAAD
ncbi:MAG TPA: Na+/H+ antiporter NhaC family protein [Woeseiaceae bacterium]|nr:Na+/H+ antiporter NhaC family protein [Woeseiaceae bacterium]